MCPSPNKPTANRDPKPEALARRLIETFKLIHIVDSKTVDDSLMMMNDSGLTVPQLIALHVLRFEGVRSVGEIADRTCLSRPATSHLVDRLVVMGLMLRVEDEHDRRQKQISLSPRGLTFMDRLFQSKLAHMATGIKALSPETRARLYEVLEDMARELKERASACCGSKEAGQ